MTSALRWCAAVLAASIPSAAHADPDSTSVSASVVSAPAVSARSAVYVDLLGKGGLWGAGYDYQLGSRWIVGGVASFYELGGDRFTTLAPYAGAYLLGAHGHHRWFAHAGPELQRHVVPSPVPEWNGMTTTAISAELSSGYEYRNHVLLRAYAMVEVGADVAPGVGASVGWTF